MKMRKCELCNADAAVFCPSDAAFLCYTCDTKVHQANFLVARHLRRVICSHCNSFTRDLFSGAACPSCPQEEEEEEEDDGSGSLSSSCVSSTTSSMGTLARRRRRRRTWRSHEKAEGIFVNWCGKLRVVVESGPAVRMACRGMKACVNRLPLRVCLAASMWLGLRLSNSALTWKLLKRLEEISGVPAKIILAAESKLGRAVSSVGGGRGGGGEVVDGGDDHDHERLVEGWAEC